MESARIGVESARKDFETLQDEASNQQAMTRQSELWVMWGLGYVARALVRALDAPYIASHRYLEQAWDLPLFRWSSGSSQKSWKLVLSDQDLRALGCAASSPMVWLVSYPPNNDPLPKSNHRVKTIIYLSATSVYGNHDGAWVHEMTPPRDISESGARRREAELQWQAWARNHDARCVILRLGGIYGPSRNVFRSLQDQKARSIHKPGHTFNRIHSDDIVQAIILAADGNAEGIFNIVDDCPAQPIDVLTFATNKMACPLPPKQELGQNDDPSILGLSLRAAQFWREHKRVSNARAKKILGWNPKYPDYRSGLYQLWNDQTWSHEDQV